MKKYSLKNLLATILAVVVLCTTLFSAEMLSVFADAAVFSDDFSSASLNGWVSGSTGAVKTGVYTIGGQEANAITETADKEKLWISADVSVNIGADSSGLMQNSVASLVINGNKELTQGYEFGIGVTKTGVTYARLYLRGDADTSRILAQKNEGIEGTTDGLLSAGKAYKLSVGSYEGTINCFINDKLVFSFSDSTYKAGYCGVKTAWSQSVFDNVRVDTINEKEVDTLEIKNAPASISRLGELSFDVYVTYKGEFHQDETVPNSDSRVTMESFTRTVGKKTRKVTFGGKSVNIKFEVTDVKEDVLIYSDDFSKDTSNNYKIYEDEHPVESGLAYVDGVIKTPVPKIPVGFNSPLMAKYTLKEDFYKGIDKYFKVSADACIFTDTSGTENVRRTNAEISTHTDASGGVYKFRIDSTGKASLIKDSETILSTSVNSVSENPFEIGKPFNFSMSVQENIIICSFNGVDVIFYTDTTLQKATKKIYLGAAQGSVHFDNLKIYALEGYSRDAVKSVKVYSAVDNKELKTYIGKSFSTDNLYLVATYVTGVRRTVGLTEDMLSGYDKSVLADQTVTITYGAATTSVKFRYSKYLFFDDFDNGISPLWSATSAKNSTKSIKNNKLNIAWNGDKDSAQLNMSTEKVEGADKWKNYQVSAEFTFNTSMTKHIVAGSFFSIYFRKTGNTYYDLRLITRGGNVQMSMYRYIDGKNEQVMSLTTNQLKNLLPAEVLPSNGTTFKVSALCKDEYIYIYINDILAATYVEMDENGPQGGYVGMKLFKASGMVDNFTVEEKSSKKIVKFNVAEIKNNTFEIYEGFEICPNDYTLNCYDADGTMLTEYLTEEMISPYDNLQVGAQNIIISAFGIENRATLVVKQRDDYIKALDKDIKELDVKKLELSDKEKVYDIVARYDELSGYEITKLSKDSIEKIKTARDKMERLVYPEIADIDILYFNDFNEEDDKVADEWIKGYETSKGVWSFSNSTYRLEQKRYNIYHGAWQLYEPLYAQFNSVSARIKMLNEDEYPGLVFNVTKEGHYQARLKMDYYDDNGNMLPMLQVLRNDERVFAVYLSGYGVDVKMGEWVNMMMTLVDGNINVYVNEKLIVSFNDAEHPLHHTVGRAGIYSSGGNVLFDNFTVRGTKAEEPAPAVKPTPTEYKDDFEDEKENSDPSHWVEVNTKDNFKTVKRDKNTYYGTSYTGGYTYSWLHVFDSNPTVSMDFMSDKFVRGGKFGFILRMSPETAYLKVCYDYDRQKWCLIDTQAERDCDINTTYSDKQFKLENGKWYNISITANGQDVAVKIDGETVLDVKKVTQISHGRVGILADGASIYIDNVKCTFPDGSNIQDGVIEYTAVENVYGGAVDPTDIGNGEMVFVTDGYAVYSNDYGKTAELVSGSEVDEDMIECDPALTERFTPMDPGGGYNTIMKLHDGSFLQIKLMPDETRQGSVVYKSTDNCKTWKHIGYVEPEFYDELSRRRYTFHNNTLTEYQLADGTWRLYMPLSFNTFKSNLTVSAGGHYTLVYYSDDGGYTWTPAKNDTRDVMVGYSPENLELDWAESKVVQCTDGSMRMYYSRGWIGCITYTESFDNGVTWEGHYSIPEMQTAKASHNIVQDKKTGYYYMVWVNNNPVKARSNFSRTRGSVALSKDGKTWEFLCDVERMQEELYGNDINNSTPIMQIVDPAIEVTDDYLYVTMARSDGTDPTRLTGLANYHNALRLRIVRIEKDKLEARPWDASNISNMLNVCKIELEPAKTRYGVGDIFSHIGGKATLISFDGSKRVVDTSRLYLYEEPDTFVLGKHTVTLYNANNIPATYEIEVLPKYSVNLTVTGPGIVDEYPTSVLEGDTLKIKLKPNGFFNKVAGVYVNGERVRTPNNTLKVTDIKEHLDITVNFAAKGILDYLLYIVLLLLAAGIILLGVFSIIKKRNPFKLLAQVAKSVWNWIKALCGKVFRRKKNV